MHLQSALPIYDSILSFFLSLHSNFKLTNHYVKVKFDLLFFFPFSLLISQLWSRQLVLIAPIFKRTYTTCVVKIWCFHQLKWWPGMTPFSSLFLIKIIYIILHNIKIIYIILHYWELKKLSKFFQFLINFFQNWFTYFMWVKFRIFFFLLMYKCAFLYSILE